MAKRTSPESCANCGADIPPNARACPECGADERTGWAEASIYDGLDLPEDESESNTTDPSRQRPLSHAWFWYTVGVVLILLLILGALGIYLH